MRRRAWVSVLVLSAVAGGLWFAFDQVSTPAVADVGGFAEVKQLELRYFPESDALDTRFTLVTGLAIEQRFEDPADIERLLMAADAFANRNTRMFASVEDGKITAWNLSIP